MIIHFFIVDTYEPLKVAELSHFEVNSFFSLPQPPPQKKNILFFFLEVPVAHIFADPTAGSKYEEIDFSHWLK